MCLQRTEESTRCSETPSWRFMSHYVGAGIGIQVLCKRNHTRNPRTIFPVSMTDLLKHVLLYLWTYRFRSLSQSEESAGLFVIICRLEGCGLWGLTP